MILTEYTGQLEKTMLNNFCASGNLSTILQSMDSPLVRRIRDILGQNAPSFKGLSEMKSAFAEETADSTLLTEKKKASLQRKEKSFVALDENAKSILLSSEDNIQKDIPGWKTPEKVYQHQTCWIGDVKFEILSASKGNSLVFFRPYTDSKEVKPPTPGRIQQIFSLGYSATETQYFFVIHQYRKVSPGVFNPFTPYKDFGADLWSSKFEDSPAIVPGCRITSHGIAHSWRARDVLVIKDLEKVRIPHEVYS